MDKFGKKNKVSLNPLDANICLLGLPKIGKTTIMKEVAEKLVGEDGYLFLEMYRENGAKYIEDIVYEDVPDWDTFVEIIDDIISNKAANGVKEGKTQEQAEKDARSSVQSSFTKHWKAKYVEACNTNDEAEKSRIKNVVEASGIYEDVDKTLKGWEP